MSCFILCCIFCVLKLYCNYNIIISLPPSFSSLQHLLCTSLLKFMASFFQLFIHMCICIYMHIYLNIRIWPAQSVKCHLYIHSFQANHKVVNKPLVCSSGETIAPTLGVIQLPVALCVGLKPQKRLPLHRHSHCGFNIGLEKVILVYESSLKITGENDASFSFAFRDKVKMLVNKMIYFHVFQEWILRGQVKQNYPGDNNHYAERFADGFMTLVLL